MSFLNTSGQYSTWLRRVARKCYSRCVIIFRSTVTVQLAFNTDYSRDILGHVIRELNIGDTGDGFQ